MPRKCSHPSPVAIGYLRRSTDMQEQSLGDQRIAIESFAAEHGYAVARWYVDDAISGTSSRKRAAFLEMISDACDASSPFNTVLVYDVKRFGRMDSDETGYFRFLLRMHGVEVVYVSEPFSGSTDEELIRPVMQWLARQESKDLAKVTIRGRLSVFQTGQGWWMGGMPPYGYDRRFESAGGKFLFVVRIMRDRSKLLLDQWGRPIRTVEPGDQLALARSDRSRLVLSAPERVAIVRRIFHDCVHEGCGYRMIAARLNQEGVETPLGEIDGVRGVWTGGTVRCILRSPIYTGDLVWNRLTHGRFFSIRGDRPVNRAPDQAGLVKMNPQEEWLVQRDAHPAIVSRPTWHEAAALMRERHGACRRVGEVGPADDSHARNEYILTGLAACARCGAPLWGIAMPRHYSRRGKKGYKARLYACRRGTKKARRCHRQIVRRRVLDRVVAERVAAWYQEQVELRDASVLRDLASRQARTFVAKTGGRLTSRALKIEAQELETRARAFIAELPGPLFDRDPQRRRLAVRRCVQKLIVDIPGRRVHIRVRRFPILGATAGGSTSITAHLPDDPGKLAIGPRKHRAASPGRYDLEWHVSARTPAIRDLVDRTREFCLSLSPGVSESYHQVYIAFSAPKHFACVKVQAGRLLLYLKLDYDAIPVRRRSPGLRDVREIPTQTTGNLELPVASLEDLAIAEPFIRDSYAAVAGANA